MNGASWRSMPCNPHQSRAAAGGGRKRPRNAGFRAAGLELEHSPPARKRAPSIETFAFGSDAQGARTCSRSRRGGSSLARMPAFGSGAQRTRTTPQGITPIFAPAAKSGGRRNHAGAAREERPGSTARRMRRTRFSVCARECGSFSLRPFPRFAGECGKRPAQRPPALTTIRLRPVRAPTYGRPLHCIPGFRPLSGYFIFPAALPAARRALTSTGRNLAASRSSTPLTYLWPSAPPKLLASSMASLMMTR